MTDEELLKLAKTCGFGTYTNDDGTPYRLTGEFDELIVLELK